MFKLPFTSCLTLSGKKKKPPQNQEGFREGMGQNFPKANRMFQNYIIAKNGGRKENHNERIIRNHLNKWLLLYNGLLSNL